ncbi:hypothetical protein KIH74_16645 [Kineosporia sp. J2-2]|uniref:Glyoxalase-like domain-containing protein n=1 Tax=Kineosporia corallincola TaxID=2835133 RepID=A0ABS5TLT7_9ACTN|nr:VOC family protein [Kineosporia corallincola]MBT0770574.1 hypothetical protein [Kineosporia corallincola]
MPTRLTSIVIDSADAPSLARWWADALDWGIAYEDADESDVVPPEGEPGIELTFCPVPEGKTGWNRVHLDLASRDAEHQRQTVARLEQAGATRVELGVERPWVVLTDPEGNEFCVLEPRPEYDERGPVAAVVIWAQDPANLGAFWQQAAGGELEAPGGPVATLTLTTPGPLLEFVHSDTPKTVKNRLHLDVRPYSGDDQAAEVSRLLNLGALRTEVGQSSADPATITWVVLVDPEGNEFCVLRPRGEQP